MKKISKKKIIAVFLPLVILIILILLAAFLPLPGKYSFEGAWRYDASENRYCTGDYIYLTFRNNKLYYRVSDGGTSPCSPFATNPVNYSYTLDSSTEDSEGPSVYVLMLDYSNEAAPPLELTFWPGTDSLNVFGDSFKRLTFLEEILIKITPTTLDGYMIFTP